jgi:hypothetical protein
MCIVSRLIIMVLPAIRGPLDTPRNLLGDVTTVFPHGSFVVRCVIALRLTVRRHSIAPYGVYLATMATAGFSLRAA